MYFLLEYDYVPDILARREPYRGEHLSQAQRYFEQGMLTMAGATGSPVSGATFVFTCDESEINDFVNNDPYIKNDLVTDWRIVPWTVVVGG